MPGGEVTLVGLTKRFDDVVAVKSVNLNIAPGEFFSLLGPSGCGKTTTLRMIAAGSLAREMQAPALTGELGTWGFEAASDRYFQGESRRLQVVDSRTLRFGRVGGAVAYVGFVRAHVSAIVGSFPVLKPLVSGGRSGFLAVAQECQCHLANPAFLAVLARGRVVTWLEINGPGADRRQLVRLLAGAP